MSRNWLAVASADHVAIGRRGGFMQVCHGKAAPLRRIQPGDTILMHAGLYRNERLNYVDPMVTPFDGTIPALFAGPPEQDCVATFRSVVATVAIRRV